VEQMLSLIENTKGETAALTAALAWAVASVIWARTGRRVHPLELNLIKGLISIALLALTLALQEELFVHVEARAIFYLAIGGAIGIALGDTAYFESINVLGARRALLLTMLAPPLAGWVAWMTLGERLRVASWGGIALTVLGVAWVITERYHGPLGIRPRVWRGVWMGFLAALAQVVGAVFSRAAFAQTTVTPLMSALLRMSAACVVLIAWILIARTRGTRSMRYGGEVWLLVGVAAIIGTFVGISLQQYAFKYADTGVAQTLLSTSPLFILPIAVWMGERVSPRAVLGVIIAMLGIAMLFGIVG
jgi:drug/metabolite transporter (DMT)-like permease